MQPTNPTDSELEKLARDAARKVADWFIRETEYEYQVGDSNSIAPLILAALKGVRDRSAGRIEVLEAALREARDEIVRSFGCNHHERFEDFEEGDECDGEDCIRCWMDAHCEAALSPEPTPVIPEVLRDMSPDPGGCSTPPPSRKSAPSPPSSEVPHD